MEKTLIIFKPDSVMRGLVGEILARFERAGYKIVGTKMLAPDRDHYHKHYESIGALKTRRGEEIFESQLNSMLDSPVIAMVLEGIEAVETVRKMVGSTEPRSAAPGTIRGDYAHATYDSADGTGKGISNLIHASATKEEADQEITLWFKEDEIHSYEPVHTRFTQPKK